MTIGLRASADGLSADLLLNGESVATLTEGAFTVPKVITEYPLNWMNRVINGDMRIDQRNEGAAVSADNSFPVDRFVFRAVGGAAVSMQRSTVAPVGFVNSLAITVSTADAAVDVGDNYHVAHRIEGHNVSDLAFGTAEAKDVAVSFYVRSSVTGTFGGCIQNGIADRSYVFEYTVNAANTFERKTITIPGDQAGAWYTDNLVGVSLIFDLGSGANYEGTALGWNAKNARRLPAHARLISTSGATLYITGIQLEAGSVASPFNHRPYQVELAMCQRYYEKTYNEGIKPGTGSNPGSVWGTSAASQFHVFLPFRVTKRAVPTITYYDRSTGTAGYWASYVVSDGGVVGMNGTLAYIASIADGVVLAGHVVASAEL